MAAYRPYQLCTSGSGLFLMEALAARWGHEPAGSGLLLWFEFDPMPT